MTQPAARISLCVMLVVASLHLPALAQPLDAGPPGVSIKVFDHSGAGANAVVDQANVEIVPADAVRLAEMRYIPMQLRYRIEASERFGPVRVLPVADNGAELAIEGRILHSSESRLELALLARDSTGRIWLDRTFTGNAVSSQSLQDDALQQDDFQALYSEILRALLAVLDQLDAAALQEIHTLALLRYGLGLVPQSFSAYISETADGRVTIERLPARQDPLLVRIEAIREREFLFIDVVDEEYRRFHADIKPVYDMWRSFRREQASNATARITRESNQGSLFPRGSYYALQESYNNYRWAKLQDLYLDELQEGFANETGPTEIELSDSVYRLSGTLEQQYREWRSILAELYLLETQ
jgi:hypothetical protein